MLVILDRLQATLLSSNACLWLLGAVGTLSVSTSPYSVYYRANLGLLRVIALMFCLLQELFTFFILQETGFRRGTCAGQSNFLGVQVTWSQLVVLAWGLSFPPVTHLPSSSEDPAGVYVRYMFLLLQKVTTLSWLISVVGIQAELPAFWSMREKWGKCGNKPTERT